MTIPAEGSAPDRARLVTVFALVVTLLAAVFIVLGVHKHSADHDNAQNPTSGIAGAAAGAKTAVTDAAQYAVDYTSFDYHSLTQGRTNTASHFTPAFAKAYLVQSKALAPSVVKVKAVAVAKSNASGLLSYDPAAGTAVVMVALDVTTKNVQAPDGAVRYYRLAVEMQRQGNTWLANKVEPV